MAPAIQNLDTKYAPKLPKIRSQTAKNTLLSVEIQKYAPKMPKWIMTLPKLRLRSWKPWWRFYRPRLCSQKPRLRSWQPKLRSQKPRLRSWNLNYAPKNQDYAHDNLNYAPKNQDSLLEKYFRQLNCRFASFIHVWSSRDRSEYTCTHLRSMDKL